MAYYPSLPVVRDRGVCVADRICTELGKRKKRRFWHPSLLPGIFTVFCPHGTLEYRRQCIQFICSCMCLTAIMIYR